MAKLSIVENLVAFGKTPIIADIIIAAEKFLVKCIDRKTNCEKLLRIENGILSSRKQIQS